MRFFIPAYFIFNINSLFIYFSSFLLAKIIKVYIIKSIWTFIIDELSTKITFIVHILHFKIYEFYTFCIHVIYL